MKNLYNPNIYELQLPSIIGLDTEFSTLDTLTANIAIISINDPFNNINYAFDVNNNIYTYDEIILLIQKIQQCKIVLGHNIKVDIAVLYSNYNILFNQHRIYYTVADLLKIC